MKICERIRKEWLISCTPGKELKTGNGLLVLCLFFVCWNECRKNLPGMVEHVPNQARR